MALIITLDVVFNAETLAWPIMLIRFKMSEGARKRMCESSIKWSLEWEKAVKVMTKLEDDRILRDDEAPRWPGNKMVYLLYWVVYLLIEFPAKRIVIGTQSFISLWHLREGSRSASNLVRLIIQIGVGLLLTPVFLIVWSLSVPWTVAALTPSAARRLINQSLAKIQGKTEAEKVRAARDDAKLDGGEVPDEGQKNNDENKTEDKKTEPSARQIEEEEVRKYERLEKQSSMSVHHYLSTQQNYRNIMKSTKNVKRPRMNLMKRQPVRNPKHSSGAK